MLCRCEEIAQVQAPGAVREGATHVNEVKAWTRAGMGRCQGRMCGPALRQLIGRATGRPVPLAGAFTPRPPVKPVRLAALSRGEIMTRPDITLTPAEQRALLAEPLKAALATVDADGFPHIVAMSFLARDDGAIYMTSYAKAQKVLNVRRNPKVAVMIETGQQYAEFRAVMIRGRCEVIEDAALVEETIRDVAAKRAGRASKPERRRGRAHRSASCEDRARKDRELGSHEARRAI